MFEELKNRGYTVKAYHHAEAIIGQDLTLAITELSTALEHFKISVEEIVRGGGGEADLTQRLRNALDVRDWKKHNFEIEKLIDGKKTQSLSHEIDHVRNYQEGVFALEIEWNNKDPFFDRDLENFKRLHAEGAISVGGIITRGQSLQDGLRQKVASFARAKNIRTVDDLADYYTPTPRQIRIYGERMRKLGNFADGWADAFVGDKFGEATTHWRKLEQRMQRGVGNPCPLLLIGIPDSVVTL